jgi:RNA polymerase sigma factor (TIGR02999 family)
MSEVTQILERVNRGKDPNAQDELLKAVYNELRIIAKAKMANEKPGHTLQATILVNDAWLKIFPEGKSQTFNNSGHFFGTAAIVMHRILVDHARRRLAVKRGGDLHKTQLSDNQMPKPRDYMRWLRKSWTRISEWPK